MHSLTLEVKKNNIIGSYFSYFSAHFLFLLPFSDVIVTSSFWSSMKYWQQIVGFPPKFAVSCPTLQQRINKSDIVLISCIKLAYVGLEAGVLLKKACTSLHFSVDCLTADCCHPGSIYPNVLTMEENGVIDVKVDLQ